LMPCDECLAISAKLDREHDVPPYFDPTTKLERTNRSSCTALVAQ
jgi:hypothetical protein